MQGTWIQSKSVCAKQYQILCLFPFKWFHSFGKNYNERNLTKTAVQWFCPGHWILALLFYRIVNWFVWQGAIVGAACWFSCNSKLIFNYALYILSIKANFKKFALIWMTKTESDFSLKRCILLLVHACSGILFLHYDRHMLATVWCYPTPCTHNAIWWFIGKELPEWT